MTYFSLTCTSFEMPLAADGLAPSAFVQAELGVDQLALVLQQPLDAVVRPAAFLVRRERDDDVAIGLEAFALVANQVRDPDRRLRLVVAGAAAVEVAVLLGERERIHAPVFALRFHDVGVREQQDADAAGRCRDSARRGSPSSGLAPPTKMSASGNPAALSRRATASATGVVAPVV